CRSLIPTSNNNSCTSRLRSRATAAIGQRRRNRWQFSTASSNNKVRSCATSTVFVSACWSAWFVRRSLFCSRKSANQPAPSRPTDKHSFGLEPLFSRKLKFDEAWYHHAARDHACKL